MHTYNMAFYIMYNDILQIKILNQNSASFKKQYLIL